MASESAGDRLVRQGRDAGMGAPSQGFPWDGDPVRGIYMVGDPRREFAIAHEPRWPSTQTHWIKHLSRLNEDARVPIGRRRIRTLAQKLHAACSAVGPGVRTDFNARYGRTLPDLRGEGGIPAERLDLGRFADWVGRQ